MIAATAGTREGRAALKTIAIVGGGASGFFAAIACAEANPGNRVIVLEKGSRFLSKVRVSGGGRCNVTHACFDTREFTKQYPRGERTLISPLHRFGAAETMEWFQQRGVALKTEADGRVFPVTDCSDTIVDCFLRTAAGAGVELLSGCEVKSIERIGDGFVLRLNRQPSLKCDRLLLATGGTRNRQAAALARSLAHTLEPAVPSLFSFEAEEPWLASLAGVSLADVEVSVPGTELRERAPLLITHRGLSGPAILRLSAWGARVLHNREYHFVLRINWLPEHHPAKFPSEWQAQRASHPRRRVVNSPPEELPARLWEKLALRSGVASETRWSNLMRPTGAALAQALTATEVTIRGQSLNKDEFVTCGGVHLREINWRTMESKLVPNLFFAGELLDVDGITGGFNFQSAWTTGWIAGRAMAQISS